MKSKTKPRVPEIAYITDKGRMRELNEDAVFAVNDGCETLCLVADGMGGYEAGEAASAAAVNAAAMFWKKKQDAANPADIFKNAHNHIKEQTASLKKRCGTTLSILYCKNDAYKILHAGDSRIYRLFSTACGFRRKLELLTSDDTWVAERVREGVLTPEEAREHPKRNVITNCIGAKDDYRVFEANGEISKLDVFLLCSDGLYHYFTDVELKTALTKKTSAAQIAQMLVQTALERGGQDNISAVIVRFA